MDNETWTPVPWSGVVGPKRLVEGVVEVWMLRTPPRGEPLGEQLDVLTAEERAGASRITAERERVLHVLGRALARKLLASYTGSDARDVRLEAGRWGKPRVVSPPGSPCFNIAHSGDTVLAAFSLLDVGVDIERRRPRSDVAGIAHRFYGDEEYNWIAAHSPEDRLDSFLRLWTRKEAVVKATGLPLIPYTKEATVLAGEGRGSVVLTDGGVSHRVYWLDLAVEPGYTAAVAAIGREPEPVLRRIV